MILKDADSFPKEEQIMQGPTEKPTIEINVHGPQATAFHCADALQEAGADNEFLNEKFFAECKEAGWHRKRALLDIARKYATVKFSDAEFQGPKNGKPEVEFSPDDDEDDIMDKTSKALRDAGAGDDFDVAFLYESMFCESVAEYRNVAENYVTII